ncbi:MAG TPA: hypothetical protein VF988_10570 [Verrucomicrobiae bacterium]
MNLLTPDQLNLETFLPCLNTKFRVGSEPPHVVELELVAANALSDASHATTQAGRAQPSFTLVFHGPENRYLPQQIHTFEHDRIGRFELFIVPIGRQPGIIQYQAIFNRLPVKR